MKVDEVMEATQMKNEITINSTDVELLKAFESARANANGEEWGKVIDTPREAIEREGWTVIREINGASNPSKTLLAQHPVAKTLAVVMDIYGPWGIVVAE